MASDDGMTSATPIASAVLDLGGSGASIYSEADQQEAALWKREIEMDVLDASGANQSSSF